MGRLRRTRLCNLAEPFHDCNDIAGNLRPTDFLRPQSTPHRLHHVAEVSFRNLGVISEKGVGLADVSID
jgi:hypothetical protein